MNERAIRTERAAHRLIKSYARKHIYRAKAKQTNGTAYASMVGLEEAIEEEAALEWKAVLAQWDLEFERIALPAIIGKVALTVYRECRKLCEELGPEAKRALKRYFEEFDPKGMLG